MMRVGIRIQLGLLVLVSSLVALAVITLAIWYTNHNFVLDLRSQRLALTASLKAGQIGAALTLIRSSVTAIATRVLIQNAIQRYNDQGNNTSNNWGRAVVDLQTALNGATQNGILMQAKIFSKNDTGTGNNTILQATGTDLDGVVKLPTMNLDGSTVYLGDEGSLGYPAHLYPNITYSQRRVNTSYTEQLAQFNGMTLNETSLLFLGPWALNSSYSLASLTLPVINNTSRDDVLAWMTVIVDAVFISQPIHSPEGLDNTGVTMLIGPANITNKLSDGIQNTSLDAPAHVQARFVLAPNNTLHRHDEFASDDSNSTFDYSKFPAVQKAWTDPPSGINGAGALISTFNEEGINVAIGYAQIPADGIVDWLMLVEQAHNEVWQPIYSLRKILLACVFGTAGALLILALPIAHFSTAPIRRLRDATRNSIMPPGYIGDDMSEHTISHEASPEDPAMARKEGFLANISKWRHGDEKTKAQRHEERRRRQFRIPAKVKDRKHFINDELTDLTATFNEMSDELMVNYGKLEERVQQRTAELEESKAAAEAANEAKTLFVANISHELKTPLNGILGIAQTSQVETSLAVLKRDMRIIYNQGDLLNKLIQDLLLFSKNQVDHTIGLEESEFRVRDITTQVYSTFQVIAAERGVELSIDFEGPNDGPTLESSGVGERKEFGPFGTGRVKDMLLWGDKNRILQVVNNLTSNALKFTPKDGTVRVLVRCIGDTESAMSRKGSVLSKSNSLTKGNSGRNSRQLYYNSGTSETSETPPVNRVVATANEINALDRPIHAPPISRTASPPLGARDMFFEWEVVDTGPGMPLHIQEKVFEPFFQGDMALSKKFQGTGLGLSICAQLAKLMGGSMALRSEEGSGSSFTMRIPLKQIGSRADSTASSQGGGSVRFNSPRNSISGDGGRTDIGRGGDSGSLYARSDLVSDDKASTRSFPAATRGLGGWDSSLPDHIPSPRSSITPIPLHAQSSGPQSPDATSSKDQGGTRDGGGRSLRVLVAEDNKTNQVVVTRLLRMERINTVTIAEDGQIAYDMVMESIRRTDNFDLIFMDVQMPNMDGLEATRLIRQAGYKGPIVALSAYSDEANVKSCHEAGMDDFVSKPIQLPRLKLVLKTFCPAEFAEPSRSRHAPTASSSLKKDAAVTEITVTEDMSR